MATSWAEGFAEGFQESLYRGHLITAAILGGLLTYGGGDILYTKVRPEIVGTRATAVLLERYVACTVVRGKGRDRTLEPMPCPEAEQLQSTSGSGMLGVRHDAMARLQVSLPDGSIHEARVAEHKVRSLAVPIGGKLPVVYDRSSSDGITAPVERNDVIGRLAILAFGLLLLAFPVASVLKWLRGGPKASPASAPSRREAGRAVEPRADRPSNLQTVRQPAVQPARLAAVTRRGAVVGPAGARRTSLGGKA